MPARCLTFTANRLRQGAGKGKKPVSVPAAGRSQMGSHLLFWAEYYNGKQRERIFALRVLRLGMSGTDVMEIQALLRRLGYDVGPIDGRFNLRTGRAVRAFQSYFSLAPDGVIGERTYAILNRLLLGYDLYTIMSGDTFYEIARKYHTNPALIAIANPNADPERLAIGQTIKVPYDIEVVRTNIDYTYDIMERNIMGLKARYPFIGTDVAGQSVLGRNLYTLRLGRGPNRVFYSGAIHGLEWITAPLLMKFAEDFSRAYALGMTLNGYDPRAVWETSSIHILPMTNPDGVDLVLNGPQPNNPYYYDLIRWNGGSTDFSTDWTANVRGVDLNHNFDAGWEEYREIARQSGITGPGPRRWPGPYPESEPETAAMVAYTRSHDFNLVVAFHSQGEVIYWDYKDLAPPEALDIAERFSEASGYAISDPILLASLSGYKDWFILEYGRPGYTVEVGRGVNPLPISDFDGIYARVLPLMLLGSVVTTG